MIYFILLCFWHYARQIETIIIPKVINFNDSLTFTFLMFISELFGGLAIILYNKLNFLYRKKQNKQDENIVKILTKGKGRKMSKRDNLFKIILLIFFAAFFDFVQFIISYALPRIAVLSPTSDQRLRIMITITSSLLCTYALKFKINKHHVFSLIGMSICSLIILIFDFVFLSFGADTGYFILAFFFFFIRLAFVGFIDVTERYLVEYNNLNKFKIISSEGFFGIIFCIIFIFIERKNPIKEMHNAYVHLNSVGKKFLMIFFLILYIILSAGVNIYKIICNITYDPIAKSLPAYFLNPAFIIYYFIGENDFKSGGERNYFYFILNLILSLIIDFFALIYNEFLILYCFDLQHGTHFAIADRADLNAITEMRLIDDEITANIDDEYIVNIVNNNN